MSTMIVGDKHISAILNFIAFGGRTTSVWDGKKSYDLHVLEERLVVGQILTDMNNSAYEHNYKHPHEPIKFVYDASATSLSPMEALKAMQCLEYNSDEAKHWEGSQAQKLIRNLFDKGIALLPGYDKAKWRIE